MSLIQRQAHQLIILLLLSVGVYLQPQDKTPTAFDDLDAHSIVEPFMRPFQQMYDVMQNNAKAMEYAEKVEERRAESPVSQSKGLFDLFDRLLQTKATTTTTSPSPIDHILNPYLEPFKRQIKYFQEEVKRVGLQPTTSTQPIPTTTPTAERSPFLISDNDGMLERMDSLFSKIWKALFSSLSSLNESRRQKRQSGLFMQPQSNSIVDMFDQLFGWNKPVQMSNPFTPNPFVSLFTTPKPLSLPNFSTSSLPVILITRPPIPLNPFPLRDPFSNVLSSNSTNNKLLQLLNEWMAKQPKLFPTLQ